MSFEQTKIFSDLVNNFTRFANEHRHDVGRDHMAAEMVARWSRMHGADRLHASGQAQAANGTH